MSMVIKVSLVKIMQDLDDWEQVCYDDNGIFTQEAKDYALSHMFEFVAEFGRKLDGMIGEKVLINESGTDFHELNADLKEISFDYYDDVCLYILINKEVDAIELNDIFLDMPKFGQFSVVYPNHVELITQSYDWGEHDTGYFADWVPEDNYIIGFANEDGSYKQNEEKPYYDEVLKTYNSAIKALLK